MVYTYSKLSRKFRYLSRTRLDMVYTKYIPCIYFTSPYERIIPLLYLVYTWYIPFNYGIHQVFTGYISLCCHSLGIYLTYASNIAYSCLHGTFHSSSMSYTWYIPLKSSVFVHFQDFVDSITVAPTQQHRTFFQIMIIQTQMTLKTSN